MQDRRLEEAFKNGFRVHMFYREGEMPGLTISNSNMTNSVGVLGESWEDLHQKLKDRWHWIVAELKGNRR